MSAFPVELLVCSGKMRAIIFCHPWLQLLHSWNRKPPRKMTNLTKSYIDFLWRIPHSNWVQLSTVTVAGGNLNRNRSIKCYRIEQPSCEFIFSNNLNIECTKCLTVPAHIIKRNILRELFYLNIIDGGWEKNSNRLFHVVALLGNLSADQWKC